MSSKILTLTRKNFKWEYYRGSGPEDNTATKQTIQLTAITLLITLGIILSVRSPNTSTAAAAYNPAPEHLVAAAKRRIPPPPKTAERRAWIICWYWRGRECQPALNVAWCESTLRPWAANGQYRGIWQLGAAERKRFGHSTNTWTQSAAAHRYYRIAGWGPWECKPH